MPAVRIDTHSAEAACAFVREGLGVGVLPELLAARAIATQLVEQASARSSLADPKRA